MEADWYRYKYQPTSGPSYDFDLQRYLVGAKWHATAQTAGTLRVGYMTQQFSSSGVPGANGFTGDIGMEWSPLTYSLFSLNASRNINPTQGYGTSNVTTLVSLGWTHDWNYKLTTKLRLGYTYMDNQNVASNLTSTGSNNVYNQYYSASVGANYEVQEWLGIGLNYTFNSLSSVTMCRITTKIAS